MVEVWSLWEHTSQESPICKGAQLFKDPNSFGAQSLFDINPQVRPTLEEANPFGAQSWLELNVGGCPVLLGAHSSREPNP